MTQTQTNKCPFCGESNIDVGEYAVDMNEWEWRAVCTDCHVFQRSDTKHGAISAWNARVAA